MTTRWRLWLSFRFSLRTRLSIVALLGGLFAYFGSYVLRSSQGRFEPAVIGLGGVKWYDWAPQGFVTDFRWDTRIVRVYYPVWQLDRRLWHPPVHGSDRSLYPINEPANIGQVYWVWQQQADEMRREK
jgi:hypothetical protein